MICAKYFSDRTTLNPPSRLLILTLYTEFHLFCHETAYFGKCDIELCLKRWVFGQTQKANFKIGQVQLEI